MQRTIARVTIRWTLLDRLQPGAMSAVPCSPLWANMNGEYRAQDSHVTLLAISAVSIALGPIDLSFNSHSPDHRISVTPRRRTNSIRSGIHKFDRAIETVVAGNRKTLRSGHRLVRCSAGIVSGDHRAKA